jgi:hypothetical protein
MADDITTINQINQANLSAAFTWAVLILAFLTASIGLLPLVGHGISTLLFVSLLTSYELLLVGLAYSVHRMLIVMEGFRNWRVKYTTARPEIGDEYFVHWPFEDLLFGRKSSPWIRAFFYGLLFILANLIFYGRLTT